MASAAPRVNAPLAFARSQRVRPDDRLRDEAIRKRDDPTGLLRFARDDGDYTSRLCSTAAPMNDANSGCGANGRDFSSGWNCTPMNQG